MNDLSLKIENLRKQMPKFSLEGSLEIGPSERVALMGRSGAGKTTLLRIIAGLERLEYGTDEGRIFLGGQEITRVPVQKREIGFVFQEQALFTGRTVFQNLAFGLEARKVPADECRHEVGQWLEKLGLQSRAHEKIDHLSGGERQRVALARALITKPKVLLLDEPFVGLDVDLRQSLAQEIVRLHTHAPVPLLFVSHEEQDERRIATGQIRFEESKDGQVRRLIRVFG